MPRSPSDATRFTSTGPYVSFNPNTPQASATQINFGAAAPSNETPQQKIARLRAAAQLAKQSKETGFDKTVRIGRVWADRAHRATAIGLIGLTVVSAAVATAGITDMLLHNRRRRNEWLAEKQMESARELAIAKHAEAQGIATEDQRLLINRERAAEEAALAKKNRPGMFKRASNWMFSGMAKEDQKGGKLGAGAAAASQTVANQAQEASASLADGGRSVVQAVEEKVDSHRRTGEMVEELIRPAGGPLDRQAQAAANAATNTTRSWTSWITGR